MNKCSIKMEMTLKSAENGKPTKDGMYLVVTKCNAWWMIPYTKEHGWNTDMFDHSRPVPGNFIAYYVRIGDTFYHIPEKLKRILEE